MIRAPRWYPYLLLVPAALVNLMLVAVGVVTNLFVLVALELVALAFFVWLVARLGRTAGDKLRAAAKAEVTA